MFRVNTLSAKSHFGSFLEGLSALVARLISCLLVTKLNHYQINGSLIMLTMVNIDAWCTIWVTAHLGGIISNWGGHDPNKG